MSLQPEFETFEEQVASETAKNPKVNTFPVHRLILANDLTPHSAYLKLAKPGSETATRSFLLESATKGQQVERYSFIGTRPRKTIISGPGQDYGEVDPLTVLEEELNKYEPVSKPFSLPPFIGGSVGYVSYDCVRYFEPKTAREQKDPIKIPESVLMLFDTIVAFDNVFQRVHIIHNIHVEGSLADFDLKAAYTEAEGIISGIVEQLEGPDYTPVQGPVTPNETFKSNIGKDGYKAHVRKLQEHIKKGDIIQAVPSQRIEHPTDLHPFNIYRQLRTVNPSPYMFYLDLLDFQIIGASPELLVKIDTDGRIINHPIAGTIRRGATAEEDDELAQQLLQDEKERAEHVMLVDLARNDINRVCKPSTSRVDSFMKIERFSHVSHIVSECSGKLRDDKTRFDALRSIFPAGTVSGAPKVKAMELIAELEGERRGVYAGAVGHWGYDKSTMDTCIALRTMTYKDGKVYLQAGGGIVFDSDPDAEFQETENKAGANKQCLRQAERIWAEQTKSS